MIIFYEGTPGSGKSYDAVRKILDNLRLGRTVYTNLDGLEVDKCREHIKTYCDLDDYELGRRLIHMSPAETQTFWRIAKPGTLIVVDEAQKYFNSRNWQSKENNEFASWASTHRHHGYDLVLITQNVERVDTAVRTLAEWVYRYKKLSMFGSMGSRRYCVYAYSDCDSSGKPLSKSIKSYDSRVFACYSSYVASDTKELGIQKHVNIFKHPVFLAIPVVLIIFVWLFSKSSLASGDLFGTKKMLVQADAKAKSVYKASSAAPNTVFKPLSAVNSTPRSFNSVTVVNAPVRSFSSFKTNKSSVVAKIDPIVVTGIAGNDELTFITLSSGVTLQASGSEWIQDQNKICGFGKCYEVGKKVM